MPPKTITTEVFTFDELDDSGKEAARDWYRGNGLGDSWQGEAENTLNAFAAIMPIKIKSWSYGDRSQHISFEMTIGSYSRYDEEEIICDKLSGVRLWKWLNNNGYFTRKNEHKRHIVADFDHCTLTGYCLDHDILEPLADFYRKPDDRTLRDIMRDCLEAWLKAAADDQESQYTDEAIDDSMEANGWTFTAAGKRFG